MLKIFKNCIRQYKAATILSIIFVVCEVAMECCLPFVTSKLVDQMNDSNTKLLVIYSVLLICMAALSLTFGALAGKYSAKASAGFATNLRHDMYDRICDYSFANIDKFQTSSLVTRMTTDVTNVQMAYMTIIRTAIRSPLMLVFSIVMAFVVAPELAVIYCFVLPVLLIGIAVIMICALKKFRKIFKKYDALNESVQENISGIRVVKSYVREEHEKKKFNKASGEVKKEFTKADRIVALNGPLMQACVWTALAFVFYFGACIITKNSEYSGIVDGKEIYLYHRITVGQLQAVTTYGFQSLMALMMLSMVVVMITIAFESSIRICEVLKEEPTLKNPENPIYEVSNGDIEFNDVSFKYKENAQKYALSNINISIKSGETIGILGGTGSSKTTLVNLISRLYDVSTGEIKVGGINVKDYDIKSLRDQVSVVLQKNLLFSGTIKDNLLWGNKDATDEEIVHVCKLACADEFIQNFPNKYDTFIEQGGTNVSGGQKQRLCIARALLKNPKILILDDSTSAVDTKTDAIIRKGFKEYIPETTKIIIAQRVASIMDADKIIIMENGTVQAIGTHEELLKSNSIYQEIYYSQNKVGDK